MVHRVIWILIKAFRVAVKEVNDPTLAYTSPNRSGVGAIDNPDRFEQAFVQYYIPEDPENFSRTTFRWSVVKK